MIPEKAIEKAIESGWDFPGAWPRPEGFEESGWYTRVALDPSFWQALFPNEDTFVAARHFCALVLTGGDIKKFWEEILE